MLNEDIIETRQLNVSQPRGYRGRFIQATFRLPDTQAQTANNYLPPFFTADRRYEIVQVTERHVGAGGAGATVTVYVTPSGTAGGAGKSVCTIDLTTTANTNQNATLSATLGNRFIEAGDSLTAAGANIGAVLGVGLTVYLKAL